jgi:hypothetical protein
LALLLAEDFGLAAGLAFLPELHPHLLHILAPFQKKRNTYHRDYTPAIPVNKRKADSPKRLSFWYNRVTGSLRIRMAGGPIVSNGEP